MKIKKNRIIWAILLFVILIVGGTTYYLLAVQKILLPIEERYTGKAPDFTFSNTVAYVPEGNKSLRINATTDNRHDGTCTFVFTKGSKRIEVTNYVANGYTCTITKPFSFFGEDGSWSIFILLRATDGQFAIKQLNNVEINSNYKPQELTFTSVNVTYRKDANGDGVHTFVAHMSGSATGNCYFLFYSDRGKSIGDFATVSKYIPVDSSNACTLEISATEFKTKGWWNYSVSFTEPYNRYHFNTYSGQEFIFH